MEIKSVFTIALGLFVSVSASAASFSCSKARPGVEQVICLTPSLSQQDEDMAALYRKALAEQPGIAAVRQSQRDWLRLVRNQCTTADCLSAAYDRRIKALSSGRTLDLDSSLQALKAVETTSSDGVQYLPATQNYKPYADWLVQNHLFESALSLARAAAPSVPMPKVVGWECDSNKGAFYLSEPNLVVVCYQFVAEVGGYHVARLQDPTTNATVEGRRMFLALEFAVLHEIGHSLLHRQQTYGSLGAEEVEADTFASVIILSNAPELNDVVESVVSVWGLTTTFGMKAQNTWEDYSDEHSLPQERFARFACLAVGRNSSFAPWILKTPTLKPHRVERCPAEWQRAAAGLKTLVLARR